MLKFRMCSYLCRKSAAAVDLYTFRPNIFGFCAYSLLTSDLYM
jgi:hypothetical protein